MGVKFSIITVCFNSKQTIEETLDSVIKQTYNNYEHIIIDGKSKDGTLDIINRYMSESKKVILLSEEDTGIYNAMNKGIDLASGDLVVFLNSDDTFEPDALELINKYYNDKIDLIYGNVSWQEKFKGKIYEKELNLAPNMSQSNKKNNTHIMSKYHLEKIQNAHNATFVKTAIIKQNLFDEQLKICSDYKFFLNMYIQKRKVLHIPYRITNMKMGGISTTQLELGLEEHVKCEIDMLKYSYIDINKRKLEIKKTELIKRITKSLLPPKMYVRFRYLNKGWSLK
ncbi:glycosyltransferase [Romboutsia weinsteinii]|uniref:Glycosyltransferase n=1 Tax=Romboutsia weinsteinii TaxID=2020949 RepID=A0A371J400_9FIRM|nr:glycosyltransferase family 2 protein [Romboutsia weinsteinii]RDY27443.1 glycosyltransferase [Romboutsia weinsteinii]